MKLAKFAFVCAAVASLTAVADGEATSSTLGLMKVDNPNNLRTIPVGINFAAADGSAVSVSNAVKTAGLPEGTLLYAYNKSDSKYYIYSIDGNAWTSNAKYSVDGNGQMTLDNTAPANAMLLPAGSAAFLVLPSTATPEQVNVITAGKPVDTAASGVIGSGVNLCCFPVGKAVNLNQTNTSASDYAAPLKATPTVTQFVENSGKTAISTIGDTIVVLRSDSGSSRVYYYDGTNWGYIGKASGAKTFITSDATIPGGVGFWYNSVQASN